MKIRDIIAAIEKTAPLGFQDGFDNSGLQTGFPDSDTSAVLVCLDITEDIVDEAIARGCGLIVSHHPLIFKALRQVGDATYQQRCVVRAIRHGIAIYSAHTSLDNAPGGVNHRIASIIGLQDCRWLSPKDNGPAGSGLVGTLAEPVEDREFFGMLKARFEVKSLRCSAPCGRMISKVALCGGAGAFLLPEAVAAGADCFISGEFHYHDYFENAGTLLAELGHYQSEQFTIDLLCGLLSGNFPELRVVRTSVNTNPVNYL